ncbi:TonB-dependent receptor [Stutzerimonas azotifigens]|uniref:TonB-dependent receptor n=1 Tax=Stutzerimonas azotifigens TaxID=291995 RepID=UPI0004885BAD|nr:TonB-dependent siderophore receptor [Stutzerimonas azotifigens]
MSQLQESVPHPRLLASAIGVALGAMSGQAFAQASNQNSADDPLALDEMTVVGEDAGGYNAGTSASNKYTAPLRETPRSVTVITEQVIQDTGALSLTDALRTTSGITFGAGEGGNPAGDRPIIRGFNAESDIFVDGLRDIGSQTREVFNLEQIEVSKGPGSAYTGAGSTGGSLNLISKTAKQNDFLDAGFTYGSDQTRRYTLDVNRVLTEHVAGRLNLMKHDANVAGRDGVDVSRWGVAPTITFGLDTPTRATLSYYHLETDDMPDYGIPLSNVNRSKANPSGPVSVDRDNFYGLRSRDYRENTTDTGTFAIEHDLNDNLTISNSLRLVRTTLDYIVTNPDDSRGNVVNGLVYRSSKNRNTTNEGWINQTDLRARFSTGFIEHNLITGIEASSIGVHNHGYTVNPGAAGSACNAALLASGDCTSLSDPNPDAPWTGSVDRSLSMTDTDTETLSAYVFDTLKLNERWSLNMGLRYDDYETRAKGVNTSTGVTTLAENNTHFWNYQLGLVFNPLPNGSIYVAWSTSSNPPGETGGEGADSLSEANAILDPERNRNYEIGTKWDLFEQRLSLNAAIFRTEKTNARVTDADGLTRNIGETEINGFEIGASGTITPKWKVFANYTYLDTEIVDAGAANVGTRTAPIYVEGLDNGNEVPNAPRNSFSFWSTYQVLPRLSIGAGASYVDSRFGNTANSVEVPDYWRYDAMAQYQVSRNLDLQLNVQNLTDKRYFDQVYSTHYAHVAPGRTALLTTSFHY